MPNPTSDLAVRYGAYAGECLIDCNETVTLTSETTSYALTSNVQDPEHPDLKAEVDTKPGEWRKLAELIDLKRLQALPDKIGDPDASDAGGEWIEVTEEGATKRVDFPLGSAPAELEPLAEHLRSIRKRLSDAHGRNASQ